MDEDDVDLQRAIELSMQDFEGLEEHARGRQPGRGCQTATGVHPPLQAAAIVPQAHEGCSSSVLSAATSSASTATATGRDSDTRWGNTQRFPPNLGNISHGNPFAALFVDGPAWAATAECWGNSLPQGLPPYELLVPEDQQAPLAALLSSVLQMPVYLHKQGAAARRVPLPSITVLLLPSSGQSGLSMSSRSMEAALDRWLSLVDRPADEEPQTHRPAMEKLCEGHARAAACLQAQGLSTLMAAAISHLQQAMARLAYAQVQMEDGTDLYSGRSHHTKDLLDGLARGTVQGPFLEALLRAHGSDLERAMATWEDILRAAFERLSSVKFTDGRAISRALCTLTALLHQPALQHAMAAMLIREVRNVGDQSCPRKFEECAILGPLLRVSPLPSIQTAMRSSLETESLAAELFTQGRPNRRAGDQSVPNLVIRQILGEVYAAAHDICKRLVRQQAIQPKNAGRDTLLSWLGAAVNNCAIRASRGEAKKVVEPQLLLQSGSDGFSLGLVSLCVRFTKWLMKGDLSDHLGLLMPSYYRENPFRWHCYGLQMGLMGDSIKAPADPPPSSLAPDRQEKNAPHFATECFFLMQLSIHNCLLPAVNRYQQAIAATLEDGKEDAQSDEFQKKYRLFRVCTVAQLLDPDFAREVARFVFLEAAWLNGLLQQDDAEAQASFSSIPDFVVKDMASWLEFVLRQGGADLLSGLDTTTLMDALTGMLLRSDLVNSTVVQNRLVQLLQAMLAPQMQPRSQRGGRLGATRMSSGEAQLVASVYNYGATQTRLLPSLMKAFVEADHVVGVRADNDNFDKFHFRYTISSLLEELWKDEACLASLTRYALEVAATPQAGIISEFAGTLMATLNHVLPDFTKAMGWLHNHEHARSQAGWDATHPAVKKQQVEYYRFMQPRATSFMRLAWSALSMLITLAKDPATRGAFGEQPLAKKAAQTAVAVINQLADTTFRSLQVDEPEKYHHDPHRLFTTTAELIARLCTSSAFVTEVVQNLDYDDATMRQAQDLLSRDRLVDHAVVARMQRIISRASELNAQSNTQASEDMEPFFHFSESAPPNLEEVYKASLSDLQFGHFDAAVPAAYNSQFNKLAEGQQGNPMQQMRRLVKEQRDLRKMDLTLQLSAAIFVQYGVDQPAKSRFMILGREGTPYAGGCFMFDVFFPSDYPNVPPVVHFDTTGGESARFHTNLYTVGGKVCMSLLNTTITDDDSQGWNPESSSYYQIMMSIFGLVFVDDPFGSSPSVSQGTPEGRIATKDGNAEVAMMTVKFAMIDQLRHPRPGFEDIIRHHFRLQRDRIMAFCKHWLANGGYSEVQMRAFRRSIQELHGLLAKL